MGRLKTNTFFFKILLFVLSARVTFAADSPNVSVRHLKTVLRDQGFSGALDRDTNFRNLGVFRCGAKKYRVFYFVWAETRPDGSPGHGQQRVIIIGAGDQYVGSYLIDDPPVKVTGDSILLSNNGTNRDEIRCVDGELPSETHVLGK